MSRAARRVVGASTWEVEEVARSCAARADYEERRARERQQLRDRALASARRHGATDHWFAHWRLVGLTAEELVEARAEATLGG